ncbi:MAG: helicase [Candidatus Desulfovibrio kirbyi]|uniref:Helicase n=1 Tax=Candidatus Desulfovibrio kirbyi TaxID=2696086 RepID=A0A6L2R6H0_9BACT|nr:MAG: helicase [Candidatus Desulfovibrio kirbyi]
MSDSKNGARLIETAFPLKQTSLDAVHEKNVRHGHLSTLHIWPARRPLAACRAALLATLLPDPGTAEDRAHLCERIGGKVVESTGQEQRATQKTDGGVLHWLGTEPKNGKKAKEEHRRIVRERGQELQKLVDEIHSAYGGRPTRVLDPFSGGGAIPLEAMRLGCEAYAVDLNPVAVFVLGATLKYPQAVGDATVPLPEFIRSDTTFMKEFFAQHSRAEETLSQQGSLLASSEDPYAADLAWHVRAWGQWVLKDARKTLANRYPTYAVYEPLQENASYEPQPPQMVPLKGDGTPDVDALNKDFDAQYLKDERNPRWLARPTVAYLWARTAQCKNCRKLIPLLKTKWLCKTKNGKRVALKVDARDGVVSFDVWIGVPVKGKNTAQKRVFDQEVGNGFMSGAGATCPHCGNIISMDDLRREGKAGRLGAVPTAVVVDGRKSKEYRRPFPEEINQAHVTQEELEAAFKDVPFGIPDEPTPDENALGMSIPKYGFTRWRDLFSPRQLLALGTLVTSVRKAIAKCEAEATAFGYDRNLVEAIGTYLAITLDKIADYNSTICTWHLSGEKMRQTFARFALPITWDFAESALVNDVGGSFSAQLEWITRYIKMTLSALQHALPPTITQQSATQSTGFLYNAIVTDPPYYDAIPYSDCMDFFYIWLKRVTHGTILDKGLFAAPLAPKWDSAAQDGELIDDASRHNGNRTASKKAYEDGMAQVFARCHESLAPEGRLVVVFAHKHPDAWETLVSAMIRAEFTVTASWPIQTEMGNRMRGLSSAALSSSVWLVCKKRPATAAPGWDSKVLAKMEESITEKLRAFWDAGIRGPDFVWAATGPALTAYSAHPVVKKTASPGESMSVTEFLGYVRRMVVIFVVGRVLKTDPTTGSDVQRMDAVTAYYLLHRNDFGMEDAPAGACILYATACGLTDRDLESAYRIVTKKGSPSTASDVDEAEDDDESADEDAGGVSSGGKMILLPWSKRDHKALGLGAPGGAPVPLIDWAHKLMHLWKDGDLGKVDSYIDSCALRRNELFMQLLQALTELSKNSERSLLESISNHLHAKGAMPVAHIGKMEM